jgi:hypothetical protein
MQKLKRRVFAMPIRINYVLKVYDAKLVDVKKALEAANIKVHSIIEAHREEVEKIAEEKPAA